MSRVIPNNRREKQGVSIMPWNLATQAVLPLEGPVPLLKRTFTGEVPQRACPAWILPPVKYRYGKSGTRHGSPLSEIGQHFETAFSWNSRRRKTETPDLCFPPERAAPAPFPKLSRSAERHPSLRAAS